MLRFFAGLTGVAAILSNPAQLLGVLLLVLVGLSWVGNAIGADTIWSIITAAIVLFVLWAAPIILFISSLISSEKMRQGNWPRDKGARERMWRRRYLSAAGSALGAILIPGAVIMIFMGFVMSTACNAGNGASWMILSYSPTGLLARVIAAFTNVSTVINCY